MQEITRSGLFDKKGREICLGDTIEIHVPYRSSQTHYGENIPHPSGEYTEPLEPEIKTERHVVKWGYGMFHIMSSTAIVEEEFATPLCWELTKYSSREQLISAFDGPDSDWEYDQEDGDLAYLLREYPPNTEQELMEYLSGCEVITEEKD